MVAGPAKFYVYCSGERYPRATVFQVEESPIHIGNAEYEVEACVDIGEMSGQFMKIGIFRIVEVNGARHCVMALCTDLSNDTCELYEQSIWIHKPNEEEKEYKCDREGCYWEGQPNKRLKNVKLVDGMELHFGDKNTTYKIFIDSPLPAHEIIWVDGRKKDLTAPPKRKSPSPARKSPTPRKVPSPPKKSPSPPAQQGGFDSPRKYLSPPKRSPLPPTQESDEKKTVVRKTTKKKNRIGKKRHKKVLKNTIKGISKPAILRLCYRGGVERISGKVYEESRSALKTWLENVLRYTIIYTEYENRKTVSARDVVQGIKKHGKKLYGFSE
jgi:histone H4